MLLETFGEYAAQESRRSLPGSVLRASKRALIDWFSALIPGTPIAPAVELRKAHGAELGFGRSSLPGSATTAFAGTAAWINGSASHAVEFDDIFRDAVYHPGCPTIAAALAVAEESDASGLDLLRAIVVGYEISTRIGAAIQPAHYRYFHTTGTAGCFGAAAAAAVLCAPGDARVASHALATAATFASGLQQAFRSDAMTKALHAGHAAWVGVSAAKGAAAGVTGVLDILEGKWGFGAALCDSPSWDRVTDGLGTDYNIERITQKNHGCCGHTFAAIDAVLALMQDHAIVADDMASIRVRTYQAALDVAGIPDPKSAFEAKFSLPYVISHAALFGSVRLEAFSDARLANEAVRALMKRITIEADPELTAGFPSKRSARVEIHGKRGDTYEHFQPYRRGDPEAPLSDAEIDGKFKELVAPVLGDACTDGLLERLWDVDTLPQVCALSLATLRANPR